VHLLFFAHAECACAYRLRGRALAGRRAVARWWEGSATAGRPEPVRGAPSHSAGRPPTGPMDPRFRGDERRLGWSLRKTNLRLAGLHPSARDRAPAGGRPRGAANGV